MSQSYLCNVISLSKALCQKPMYCELKYATTDNFIGRVIEGYDKTITTAAYLSEKIAQQLCLVQNYLIETYQLGLIILDAYRPQQAVEDFYQWSQSPISALDLERQKIHYPHLQKTDLFTQGYISRTSNHCYGNTVDLSLCNLNTGALLDLGACFDYFGERSHVITGADVIGKTAWQYRQWLQHAMEKFGFEVATQEYWHFSHFGLQEFFHPLRTPIDSARDRLLIS